MTNLWFNKRTVNFWTSAAYKWWDFKDWLKNIRASDHPFTPVDGPLYKSPSSRKRTGD